MQNEKVVNEEVIENSIPSIVFKAARGYFAISSEHVTAIAIMPKEITGIPEVPSYVRGLANLRDSSIAVVDLRHILQMQALEEEIRAFETMLDARKEDHEKWAAELVRCVNEKERFTLTSDPHQCAFGKWYDHYENENPTVQFQLRKIDKPHKRLHKIADAVEETLNIVDEKEREAELEKILNQLTNEIMPKMLRLLDDTKYVLSDSVREMMLVLDDGETKGAIAVDEVVSVELLELMCDNLKINDAYKTHYVKGVTKSNDRTVLLLDEKKLLELF